MGLIGTTVVPYNIFLGSGIAIASKSLKEMRFGLGIAVLFGGIISMAVLVVGTAIAGEFSFAALSEALQQNLGKGADLLFAFGLFAAGFSSAITAPLAAAITAQSLFARKDVSQWQPNSWRYRSVWLGVLLTGILFGLTGVQPVPAIILAQALNGILLPLIAVFLFIVINHPDWSASRVATAFCQCSDDRSRLYQRFARCRQHTESWWGGFWLFFAERAEHADHCGDLCCRDFHSGLKYCETESLRWRYAYELT